MTVVVELGLGQLMTGNDYLSFSTGHAKDEILGRPAVHLDDGKFRDVIDIRMPPSLLSAYIYITVYFEESTGQAFTWRKTSYTNHK
jgi:hypothetical protein